MLDLMSICIFRFRVKKVLYMNLHIHSFFVLLARDLPVVSDCCILDVYAMTRVVALEF